MSVTRFKVGDKVKVRKDLEIDRAYGKYLFTSSMQDLVGKVNTITGIHNDADAYLLNHHDEGWTDEMLEPAEKTLSNLVSGDMVFHVDAIRKILAAVDGCYLLSYANNHTMAATWYTVDELEDIGFQVPTPDSADTTIETNGHKYNKSEVEKAVKGLEPIE